LSSKITIATGRTSIIREPGWLKVPFSHVAGFATCGRSWGCQKASFPTARGTASPSDAVNRQKMDSLVVARLMGHSHARMLQKTYFREDTDAMVGAMKKATGK
jgi:hypothetical protein